MDATSLPEYRYRIIDELLNKKSHVKTKEMANVIGERCGKEISTRQVLNYISSMKADPYWAPIENDPKRKAYFYSRQFSIAAMDLAKGELEALEFAAGLIYQYRDAGFFSGLSNAIGKIKLGVGFAHLDRNDFHKWVQTEDVPLQKGQEHLATLLNCIKSKTKVDLTYRKFSQDVHQKHVFHPYMLKESLNMWYVVGFSEKRNEIRNFAIDRILSIGSRNDIFAINTAFDHELYFKHAFGITVAKTPPEKIFLEFSKKQSNYLRALPIHSTQKIEEIPDSGIFVSIEAYPTYEFYMKLLSYGANVKVVSPTSVLKEHQRRLQEAIDWYKSK
jgi:predicted DNA-binding transcriptional regulator YafY